MDHEQFVKDNFTFLNQITSLLIAENVSPEVGERVLLWLAGLSMGRRHKILIGSDDLKLLATARKVGTGTVMGMIALGVTSLPKSEGKGLLGPPGLPLPSGPRSDRR